MKTTLKIIAFAFSAALLGACSTSMQMSKTSSYQSDDLYYNPNATYTASEQSPDKQASTNQKFAELEKKYMEILANDTTGSVDTVIYRNTEKTNPWERVLSDSYQDSYERRLRGYSNPRYGFNDWSYRYSDDYWYASGYDPAFYNIVVMGSDVWVEPRYISAMFGWPYSRRNIYYNPWYGSSYWGMGFGYYNPYSVWSYGNWYSPWNSYTWGYNAGYYHGTNPPSANNHFGRRPGGVVNYGNLPSNSNYSAGINDRMRDMSNRQVTLQGANEATNRVRTPEEYTTENRPSRGEGANGVISSRPSRQDPQNREAVTRPGRVEGVVEPVRDRDNNIVSRPSRESLNVNPTRVNPNTESNVSRPNREHNPSYTRPNTGSSNEFNRPTRGYPSTEAVRGVNKPSDATTSPTRSPMGPSREYNPPPRTGAPANTRPSRATDSGSSFSRPTSTSGGSSSGATRSTGSSTSSGSSSRSSSSSSSSSSGSSSSRQR
ncbi:MAG: hypothetical protein RBT74_12665 [Tenuifilaceae bacterium]|nr:hypothetical protein [Tenuifilaceae bacterium]